jgi:hypothetical protein
MAKKAHGRTKNKRRRSWSTSTPAKRAALKEIIQRRVLQAMEERFKATPEAGQAAAQLSATRFATAASDGPPARLLPQAQDVAYRAARTGLQRPDPRPGQVELVRRIFTMAMNDPIGDMLTRIRNAQMRRKTTVSTPASKLRERVLDVLADEGYIRGFSRTVELRRRQIRVRASS